MGRVIVSGSQVESARKWENANKKHNATVLAAATAVVGLTVCGLFGMNKIFNGSPGSIEETPGRKEPSAAASHRLSGAGPATQEETGGNTILLSQAKSRVANAMEGAGITPLGTDSKTSIYPDSADDVERYLDLTTERYKRENTASAMIGDAVINCSVFTSISRGNERVPESMIVRIESGFANRDLQTAGDLCGEAVQQAVRLGSTPLHDLKF